MDVSFHNPTRRNHNSLRRHNILRRWQRWHSGKSRNRYNGVGRDGWRDIVGRFVCECVCFLISEEGLFVTDMSFLSLCWFSDNSWNLIFKKQCTSFLFRLSGYSCIPLISLHSPADNNLGYFVKKNSII